MLFLISSRFFSQTTFIEVNVDRISTIMRSFMSENFKIA